MKTTIEYMKVHVFELWRKIWRPYWSSQLYTDNLSSCQMTAALKLKAQPPIAFFTAINQMFYCSFSFRLLPSSQLSNQIDLHSSDNKVQSWEELWNIWLMVAKNAFVCWALNFKFEILLKGSVKPEKNSGLNEIQCCDLSDTNAVI